MINIVSPINNITIRCDIQKDPDKKEKESDKDSNDSFHTLFKNECMKLSEEDK